MTHYSSSPADYRNYCRLIQQEYINIDLPTYTKDRLKMLKTLLMIPCIYSTDVVRDKFELAARENIKNEIEELQK